MFYDFDDPDIPAAPSDTSAQAIAAAGLFAPAELTSGDERRYHYERRCRSAKSADFELSGAPEW